MTLSIIPQKSMSGYRVRPATLNDVEALVHHRIGMFTDMGTDVDRVRVEAAFREWLVEMMPAGSYRAWVVEREDGDIVAGGGITVLPWPPGPRYVGGRVAFVYNIYTEHQHRRRGLARRVMDTIHGWCRENGIGLVGLNASEQGRPMYEAMGYQRTANPLMFAAVDRDPSGPSSTKQEA